MILFFRTWLAAPLFFAAAFVAGFVAFHPGWKKVAPLTDGSAASFQRAAEKINDGRLLENAAPQERVAWLLEICRQPAGLARDHALYEAIQHLQPGDFLAAVADLPALAREFTAMGDDVRPGLIEASIARWLDVDKDGALRWLGVAREIVESGAIPLPEIGAQDLGAVYGVLAAREPEWMRGQLDKLGKKTLRGTALKTLMAAEVRRDPRKAHAWLETFRGGKDWDEMFSNYTLGLSETDSRAAMEIAVSGEGMRAGGGDEGRLAAHVFMDAAARSTSLAEELLPKMEPEMRRRFTWYLADRVGEKGGDSFAWLADQVAADPGIIELASNPGENTEWMMRSLTIRDPQRTLDFIATLPEAQREALREGALAAWSSYRPATFLDWLATQPPEALTKNFKSIGSTAREEPDRFARWLATLPAGELRERSQFTLASELAKQGRTADALRQFPQNSTADFYGQAARAMGGAIGAREPAAAAQWVGTLPAGPAQKEAALGLIGAWVGQSPQAAAQWIESLPAGGTRDAATGALADALAGADPEAATAWLAQIGDPAARQSAARQVFRSWARTDADGARNWLRDFPDVSAAVKNRLLRDSR